jgi:hypothetical protein
MKATLKYDGIVFIGHMGSGKTYTLGRVAELLKNKYDIDLNKCSVASGLKQIAVSYFGMKEKDRRLLQQIGTKMREIDENVWIKALVLKIQNENLIPFGVDDVRFLNEIERLKEKFSLFVVKLQPTEEQRLEIYQQLYGRYPTEEELNDSTEIEIDKLEYNYLLRNNYNQRYITPDIETIVEAIVNKA